LFLGVILVIPPFVLHKIYFVDVPEAKVFTAYFELHHPELCSWLEESAALEARLAYEKGV
jgi:hypothetical protein